MNLVMHNFFRSTCMVFEYSGIVLYCSGSCDYQLWLRTDLYTEKYTQWFYFRVENTQPGQVYRFTIMNLMKVGI